MTARSPLASPASEISSPEWRACTVATAARSGATVRSWRSGFPGMLNVIRALRPSAETSAPPPGLSGDRMLAADGRGMPEPTVGEPALSRIQDGRLDVAPVVAWLAGPAARSVTGLTVTVDGGIVMAP